MEPKKKRSGCVTAAIIVGVILLIPVGLIVGLFFWRASVQTEERRYQDERAQLARAEELKWAESEDDGTLVLDEAKWPRFEPLKDGEAPTLERYVVFMVDDQATELARSSFLESVEGARVKWLMRVVEVQESNGELVAKLEREYRIRMAKGRGTRGSAIRLTAVFTPDSKDALLRLRRGDLVEVEGTLNRGAELNEATLPES